jgi:aminoglycoside 3-N-acetyltransferase
MPDGFDHDRLADDLRALGVQSGRDLIVHSSLRRVSAGAGPVLAAIQRAAGPHATLVVPTQTTLGSPTSAAFKAATAGLDAEGRDRFVAALRGYDPAVSPSIGMGGLAEHVRTRPAARRSGHPLASFAALGDQAASFTSVHDLDCHLGERSPMGRLYAEDAAVLLLGVGYSACSAFHLAEYRGPAVSRQYQCFVSQHGVRREVKFTSIVLDDRKFDTLGADMHGLPFVRSGRVGAADAVLFPLREAVDFAEGWFRTIRNQAIL